MTSEAEFLAAHGWGNAERNALAGDASARRYIRLYSGEKRAILMIDPTRDTARFSAMSRHIRAVGLSAPEVLAETDGLMLLEDFGDDTLASVITKDPSSEIALYRTAADVLCHLAKAPLPDGLQTATPAVLAQMIEPAFSAYVSTFGKREAGRKTALIEQLETCLTHTIEDSPVLVLRDHHAENMMWLPERDGVRRIGLLDFQDALIGPPVYDLVSMLQDARRDVSDACQAETIAHYAKCSGRRLTDVLDAFHLLGLQRNLRILGIFTRLGTERGKPGYLDLIPRVWRHIQTSLKAPVAEPLRPLVAECIPEPTPEKLGKVKAQCLTR